MTDSAPCGPTTGSPDTSYSDTPLHIVACEANGLTMLELTEAMKEDAAEQTQLIDVCAQLLQTTVDRNDKLQRNSGLPAFEGEIAPIPADAFVKRIMRYSGCSPCCLVIGILYLERLKQRIHSVCLTSHNFQRLFLTAVMEAAKFLDDHYFSNKHWAEVGGIPTAELNALELEFLFRTGFDLTVTREEYDQYTSAMFTHAPAVKADGMGSKTPSYTDVSQAVTSF